MNNPYCRLEIFCCHHLTDDISIPKEKGLRFENEDVYVENLTNITSLKNRVLALNKIWSDKQGYETEGYETYDYPGFLIFNRCKNSKAIGFCPKGWHFFNNCFSIYVNRCFWELYDDINKYIKFKSQIQGHGFDFDISVDHMDYEINLLSEELMDLELKHFLEGMKITEEIEQKVYYPEMVRRGYIDILNEI